MKIGFPIVDEETQTTHAVWFSTTPATAVSNFFFNRQKFDDVETALCGIVGLYPRIQAIMDKGYNVHMDSDYQEDNADEVPFTGDSWKLCVHLIENYCEPSGPISPNVLISCDIHNKSICPLNATATNAKADYARSNQHVLILHPDDSNNLADTDIKRVTKGNYLQKKQSKETQSTTINDLENLGKAVTYSFANWLSDEINATGHGMVFSLPTEESTRADDTIKELAYLLNMKDREHAVPKGPEETNITFRDFYGKILPSMKNDTTRDHENDLAFKDFLAAPTILNKVDFKLYRNGVLEMAMRDENFPLMFADENEERRPSRNILLAGPTGCGKTDLAISLMLNEVIENEGIAVYVGPTRMLVQEVYSTIFNMLPDPSGAFGERLDKKKDLVLSTGEDTENDWKINTGNFKIACIISEKANQFLQQDAVLNNQVTLVVVDEIHMLANPIRGGILDMLLAKCHSIARDRSGNPETYEGNLRILAITTETVAGTDGFSRFFSSSKEFGTLKEPPVTIISKQRPIMVNHYIQLYGGKTAFKKTLLAEYRSNEDLAFTQSQRRAIKNKIDKAVIDEGSTSLNELSLQMMKNHKKAIVAIPSVHSLYTFISWLTNKKRTHNNETIIPGLTDDALEALPDLETLLARSTISDRDRDIVMQGAKHGVFAHYSYLDTDVRHWMENAFKNIRRDGDWPVVLCATDTLTYGVNLPADCLLLHGVKWTRENPDTEELKQIPLTYNEFHNLVGRVGRYGHVADNVRCEVVVFSSATATKRDGVESILKNYYHNAPPRLGPSTILLSDIKRVSDGVLEGLSDVTFPSFRSIMDTLRFATTHPSGAKGSDVQVAMKATYLWQFYASGTADNQGSFPHMSQAQAAINTLVEKTLEFASGFEPKIVKKTIEQERTIEQGERPRYSLREEGAALIDTGTRPQAVSPMQEWLKSIKKTFGDTAPPVELLIPGLVAAPDLWKMLRVFCIESKGKIFEGVKTREKAAADLLFREVKALGLNNSQTEQFLASVDIFIDDHCASLTATDEKRLEKANDFVKTIFLRVSAALLMWLRGADYNEINKLSVHEPSSEKKSIRPLRETATYKAGWLATMCLRFFSKVIDTPLLKDHERDLPRLALRLKLGLPAQAMPFMYKEGLNRLFTRSEAISLLDNQLHPASIMMHEDPSTLPSLKKALKKFTQQEQSAPNTDQVQNRVKDLVKICMNYYLSDGLRLIAELALHDRMLHDHWRRLRTCIENQKGARNIEPWDDKVIQKIVSCLAVILGQDQLSCREDEGFENTLFITQKNQRPLRIKFAGPREDLKHQPEFSMVIRAPWAICHEQNNVTLSLFGGIALLIILRRRFYGIQELQSFHSWKKKYATEQFYPLHEIIPKIGINMKDIPSPIQEQFHTLDEFIPTPI
ncbi:DEAD/DEAH box helicase [Desulfobacter latus]|uniref:DEAD/DEAH box helicase n=1 Tax=Desulfobacter latus TaxID=2292 RepID=A0A850SYY9_9BACT|nr:DEAD/DEAH box helicase [Desulfobacter latus]NWH06449.1 DEAD/DEAH box helicase [Desulfobacter latus]